MQKNKADLLLLTRFIVHKLFLFKIGLYTFNEQSHNRIKETERRRKMRKKLLCILPITGVLLLTGCARGNQLDNQRLSGQQDTIPSPAASFVPPTPSVVPTPTPVPSASEPPTPVPSTPAPSTPAPQTPKPTPPAEERLIKAQTPIKDAGDNRVTNIKLCAKTLNGYIIRPGEVFSFNQAVGKRTAAKGYKEAPVIIEKKREIAVGGGVCQVSSTLYTAARDYGLTILERHAHAKPVAYTAQGNDAAVSYGQLDLQFRNNTDVTLKIKTSVGQYVTVSLYRVNNE